MDSLTRVPSLSLLRLAWHPAYNIKSHFISLKAASGPLPSALCFSCSQQFSRLQPGLGAPFLTTLRYGVGGGGTVYGAKPNGSAVRVKIKNPCNETTQRKRRIYRLPTCFSSRYQWTISSSEAGITHGI